MSVRILNNLGILSSEVPTGNLLWVDAVNGVDGLATRGRMTIPFRKLEAAKNAAFTGDTIVVLPGAYAPGEQLARAGVNWHFVNGATVVWSGSTALFNVNASMTIRVTGAGFFTGATAYPVLDVNHSSADVYFQARRLGHNYGIKTGAGITVVDLDEIIADEGSAIDVAGGTLRGRVRHVESQQLYGIYGHGGTFELDVFRVQCGANKAVYFSSGTGRLKAFEVLATSAPAVEYTYGGSLSIQNARLVSQWNNAAGRAVYASGGSAGITLHCCVLIAHTNASDSIQSVNNPFTVQFHGFCSANKPKGNNISGLAFTTAPTAFNHEATVS